METDTDEDEFETTLERRRRLQREAARLRRANETPEVKMAIRAQQREYQRRKRASYTPDELEAVKKVHREQARQRRSEESISLPLDELLALRAKQAEQTRTSRARRTAYAPDKREAVKVANRERQRQRRKAQLISLPPEELLTRRAKRAEQAKTYRARRFINQESQDGKLTRKRKHSSGDRSNDGEEESTEEPNKTDSDIDDSTSFEIEEGSRGLWTKQNLETWRKLQVLNQDEKIEELFPKYYEPASKCPVCSVYFHDSLMETHVLTHLPNKFRPFKCIICERGFTSHSALRLHRKEHAQVDPPMSGCKFFCEVCSSVIITRKSYITHLTEHREAKEVEFRDSDVQLFYQCDFKECWICFRDRNQFEHHLTSHPGSIICPTCGKCFGTIENYEIHEAKIHNKNKEDSELACPYCVEIIQDFDIHKQKHMLSFTIAASSAHMCEVCGKTLSSNDNLKLHIERFHEVENVCRICGYQKTTRSINQHCLDFHTYEHGLQCYVCGKKYTRLFRLLVHIRQDHEGLPPQKATTLHKCSYCTKIFPSHYLRNEHQVLAHPDLNPEFFCVACFRAFKTSQERDNHSESVHKRFKCPYCLTYKNNQTDFESHVRSHTSNRRRSNWMTEKRRKLLAESGDLLVFPTSSEKGISISNTLLDVLRKRHSGPRDLYKGIFRRSKNGKKSKQNEDETATSDRENEEEVETLHLDNIYSESLLNKQQGANEPDVLTKNSVGQESTSNFATVVSESNSLPKETTTNELSFSQRQALYICDKCPSQFNDTIRFYNHLNWHTVEFSDNPEELLQKFPNIDYTDAAAKLEKYKNPNYVPYCDLCGLNLNANESIHAHKLSHKRISNAEDVSASTPQQTATSENASKEATWPKRNKRIYEDDPQPAPIILAHLSNKNPFLFLTTTNSEDEIDSCNLGEDPLANTLADIPLPQIIESENEILRIVSVPSMGVIEVVEPKVDFEHVEVEVKSEEEEKVSENYIENIAVEDATSVQVQYPFMPPDRSFDQPLYTYIPENHKSVAEVINRLSDSLNALESNLRHQLKSFKILLVKITPIDDAVGKCEWKEIDETDRKRKRKQKIVVRQDVTSNEESEDGDIEFLERESLGDDKDFIPNKKKKSKKKNKINKINNTNGICSVCNITIPFTTTIEMHMKRHEKNGDDGKPYKCPIEKCEYSWPSRKGFLDHLRYKHGYRVHKPRSENTIKYKDLVEGYLKSKEGSLECEGKKCRSNPRFNGIPNNDGGIIQRHSKLLVHCDVCRTTLQSKNLFHRHLLLHPQQFPLQNPVYIYFCDAENCKQAYSNKESLICHQKTHSGSITACEKCYRSFAKKSNLENHEKIHDNMDGSLSYFGCKYCTQFFENENSSEEHEIQVHKIDLNVPLPTQGEVEYVCHICGTNLSKKAYNRHMLNKHKIVIDGTRTITSAEKQSTRVSTNGVVCSPEQVPCSVCGKIGSRKTKAQINHLLMAHTYQFGFVECFICNSKYQRYGILCLHLLGHLKNNEIPDSVLIPEAVMAMYKQGCKSLHEHAIIKASSFKKKRKAQVAKNY